MAAREIRAGKAFFEITTKNKLRAGLDAAVRQLRRFATTVAAIGTSLLAVSSAIAAPLAAATRQFLSIGDSLDKMSQRTGVSVGALSELGFAMEQSGSDAATLEKGLFGLSRTLFAAARGSREAVDALAKIGLTAKDLEGLSPDKQLERIADGMADLEDASTRGAVAQQLFGRAGRQMIPLLKNGAAGVQALRKQAEALGLTMEERDTTAAAQLTDAFNALRRVISATVFQIGAALAPTLIDLTKRVVVLAVNVGRWVKDNRKLFLTIAKVTAVVAALGVGLLAVAGAGFIAAGVMSALATAWGALLVVGKLILVTIGAIGTLLGAIVTAIASPIGIAVALVLALGAAFLSFTQTGLQLVDDLTVGFFNVLDSAREMAAGVRTALGNLLAFAQTVLGGITDALLSGDLALAGKIAVLGLQTVWQIGLGAITNALHETLGAMGDALAAGELQLAAQLLWQDIQLAFLRGKAVQLGIWQGLVNTLASLWDEAVTQIIRQAWNLMTNITKIVVNIHGMLQRTLDALARIDKTGLAAALRRKIDIDVDATLAALEEDRRSVSEGLRANKAERDEQRAEALTKSLAEMDKQIADLQASRAAAEREAAEKATAASAQRAEQLARTIQELDAAIARAKAQRKEFDLSKIFDEFLKRKKGEEEAEKVAVAPRGAFGSAAAVLLQHGAFPRDEDKRTAEASERTADATEGILSETKRRPSVKFAP